MTIIQGNGLGILMFVVAALIAGVGSLVLKLPGAVVMIAVGIGLFLMDLVIRLRSREKPGWLTKKEIGGHLYFIPVWAAGLVVIAVNIIARIQES